MEPNLLNSKSTIPSNEEVIDELTSSFNKTVVKEDAKSENGEEPLEAVDSDDIDDVLLEEDELQFSPEELKERHDESQALKEKANLQFREGDYINAAGTYTLALRTCPLSYKEDRAILFANRAACKMKREANDAAIEDCTRAISLNSKYLKALHRRAILYEKTDKLDEALDDYKLIFELDPSNTEARAACIKLPGQINERNERLKTEMVGSLKELGNKILKPFGLSTENFQVTQDPTSGGYSINFKK